MNIARDHKHTLFISFQNTINGLSEAAGWVAALMILGSVFLTCQMIFVRFVMNASTVWQTEIVVYLMVAATLLGLAFVQKHKGHVNVDLLPIWLNYCNARILAILTGLTAIIVIGVCLFYGFEFWHLLHKRGWTSDTVTAVPLWIPYLSVPVGLGLLLLQLVSDWIETLLQKTSKEEAKWIL